MKFTDFNLVEALHEGVEAIGFEKPTPIQEQAIPAILDEKDVIACAQTGTGKTAAYVLPVINFAYNNVDKKGIKALVIAPTRELAIQIDKQIEGFAYFAPVGSKAVFGGGSGDSWDEQKNALVKGTDIIVGTPGRLIAHLIMGYVDMSALRYLILDEADRMLDMGFYEDIMKIISYLPEQRQNLMFSATMPPKIRDMAKKILKDPVEINISVSKTAKGILQGAYMVYDDYKIALVKGLIAGKEEKLPSILIFSSTKVNVKRIEQELKKLNFSLGSIHSDLEQSERETVLRKFSNRQIQVLVATDIVSRGIDIENISMVINYDVPQDPEDYIHRVGRTARAESKGIAITFVNDADMAKFSRIEKLLGEPIKQARLPESIGKGPEYNPNAKEKFGNRKNGKFKKKVKKS
ncbi:MAG: DEAD/DEAH box helicase [Cyclobacteriaceae bacterium]|nr:DEAD/DEAH box helicase [Cyclobacteriaceae bacterium]